MATQKSFGTIERRIREKVLQCEADETNNNSTEINVTLNSPQSRSTHIQSSIIKNGALTLTILLRNRTLKFVNQIYITEKRTRTGIYG